MSTKNKILVYLTTLIIALLAGSIFLPAVHAGPPAQGADPRPSNGGGAGGGDGGGGGGDGSQGGGGSAGLQCASLVGQVINWGAGGEGGVTTQLDAGSWQLTTVSATDGNYGFGGLGVGPAILRVALSPEQAGRLQPLIQNAGVYLDCQYPIFANIAVAGDASSITPPATLNMSASSLSLGPAQQVNLTLTVDNNLPNEITNVAITNLLSPGLEVVNVSASTPPADVKIVAVGDAGQMAVVNFNKLNSGATVTIRMAVAGRFDLPEDAQLTSTATLFYRESVAHQAAITFNAATPAIIAAAPTPAVAPPTPAPQVQAAPTATPVPTAEVAAAPQPTEEAEAFVPPGGLPTTGDTPIDDSFVPPPNLLPVTGQDALIPDELPNTGLNPILPLSGLGLAGLVFLLHHLRASGQKD